MIQVDFCGTQIPFYYEKFNPFHLPFFIPVLILSIYCKNTMYLERYRR